MHPDPTPETAATITADVTTAPPAAPQNKTKTIRPERWYFGATVLCFLILGVVAITGFVLNDNLTLREQVILVLLPMLLGLFCLWKERKITGRSPWEPVLPPLDR